MTRDAVVNNDKLAKVTFSRIKSKIAIIGYDVEKERKEYEVRRIVLEKGHKIE